MVRASNRYLEGHGFDSRWGTRKIFFPSIRLENTSPFIFTLSKSPFHLSFIRIFNCLLKQKADIFFLQETYSTIEIENQWRKQWRDLFFSHGMLHSKGVLILLQIDDLGRSISLHALIQDSPFLLANIYAPTKASEQCQFLDKIANHMADEVCQSEHYIITGGDFNATFKPDLDCSSGRPSIKVCIKTLNDIMLQNDLVDIGRVHNPDKKCFTWRQKIPLIQRRLDFWLISNSLQDDIGNVDIVWFQKISIPPPRKVTGNSKGEKGLNPEISEGWRGFTGSSFSRG